MSRIDPSWPGVSRDDLPVVLGAIGRLQQMQFPNHPKWFELFGNDEERPVSLLEDQFYFPGSGPDLRTLKVISGDRGDEQAEAWLQRLDLAELLPGGVSSRPSWLSLLTDTVNRRVPDRAFPWIDEAQLLVRLFLQHRRRLPSAPRVLDLFCGAGSISLMLDGLGKSGLAPDLALARLVGSDHSRRALWWAAVNRQLAGSNADRLSLVEGNLTTAAANEGPFDVVFMHAPMAMHPPNEPEFRHSAGGEDGLAVLRAALRGDGCPPVGSLVAPGGELYTMAYALGPAEYRPMCLPFEHECATALGPGTIECLPHCERMWRVGRDKVFRSPIPIDLTISRLYDITRREVEIGRISAAAQIERHDRFVAWIDGLRRRSTPGFPTTHLHYIVLRWSRP